jgi:hypothetical protein
VGASNGQYDPNPVHERQLILENEHVTLWYYEVDPILRTISRVA